METPGKGEGRSSTQAVKLGYRDAQRPQNPPPPRISAGQTDRPTACKSCPKAHLPRSSCSQRAEGSMFSPWTCKEITQPARARAYTHTRTHAHKHTGVSYLGPGARARAAADVPFYSYSAVY